MNEWRNQCDWLAAAMLGVCVHQSASSLLIHRMSAKLICPGALAFIKTGKVHDDSPIKSPAKRDKRP